MLHHDRSYLAALDEERRRKAAQRRRPAELEDMVAAASSGDALAWTALVTRFRAHVKRVAAAHGLNAVEAEDVAQETLLRLYNNIGRVRDARALPGWLTTTARRESLRAVEAGRRVQPTDADLGDHLSGPDEYGDPFEADVTRALLEQALAQLPERHEQLMRMLFAEPAPSYAEISSALGIPHGSIGPIRQRCLTSLRRSLAPERATLTA